MNWKVWKVLVEIPMFGVSQTVELNAPDKASAFQATRTTVEQNINYTIDGKLEEEE